MNTVFSVLEGFEKLAYKFLLSIIFIPKTIFRIIVDPGWVPGYIKGEFKQEAEKKGSFDEFMSPVILLLIVALIPALIINFLPAFGVSISSPSESEPTTLDQVIVFNAQTNTVSGSSKIFNEYSWYVEEISPGQDEEGDTQYAEIYRETYNEYTDRTGITENNDSTEFDGQQYTYLEYPNKNYYTSNDAFYYIFPEEGEYYVNLDVTTFDPSKPDMPVVEQYSSFLYVRVPPLEDSNPQITISGGPDTRAGNKKAGSGNISDLLKKETTIFLALGLLFPPLLFALASKLFMGEEIGENTLRESFYSQCYYFSPLSLAIWATYFAGYFITPDVFIYRSDATMLQLILLPSILAVLWFMGTEIQAIARARQTEEMRSQERNYPTWKAFLIVLACTAVLVGAGYMASLFVEPYSQVQNNLRKLAIFVYPLITIVLVLVSGIAWYRRRKANNERITIGDAAVLVVPLLIVVLATSLIGFVMSPQADVPAEPTQGVDSVQPVSQELPTQAPTYTPSPSPEPTEPPTDVPATKIPTNTPTSKPLYDITGSYIVYSVCGDFTTNGTAEIAKGSGNNYDIIFHYPFGDDQGTGEFDGEKYKVWYPDRQALQTFILTPDNILRGTYLDGSRGCSWSDDLVKIK